MKDTRSCTGDTPGPSPASRRSWTGATGTWVVRAALAVAVVLTAAYAATSVVPPASAESDEPGLTARAPGSCRQCHVEACERWEKSAHALSTRPAVRGVVPREIATESAVEHPPGRSVFRGVRDGFVVETTDDDGVAKPFPLEIIVGVRRMHFLVARMADDRLQVVPPMHEVAGPWFDYTHLLFGKDGIGPAPIVRPGEPSFWTGPDRSFDTRCARCHVSGHAVEPPAGGRGPRSAWRSLGIDCVSCHGDDTAHVKHWSVPNATRKDDPIPSLMGLPKAEALAVCLPCHIEAEVLDPRGAAARGPDPFEWIEPTGLDDVVRVDAYSRPMELMYEGLAFLTSTCAEKGKFTCLACHEVHGSPKPFSLRVSPERDVALCRACHVSISEKVAEHTHHDAGGSGARCTACHMPPVPVERGHGAVRDHTIGVPVPVREGEQRAQDACTWCHTGGRGAPADAPKLDAARLDEAHRKWWPDARRGPSWTPTIERARSGDVDVVPELAALAQDSRAPRLVRVSAARLLAQFGDAAERALLRLVTDRDPLLRRGALRGLAGVRSEDADAAFLAALADGSPAVRFVAARSALEGWERLRASKPLLDAALPVLAEDAAADPVDHARWFRLGAARQLAGDVKGAIEAYERKVALDPNAKAVRETLEKLRAKLGK